MAVQSEGQGSWTPEGEDEECRRLAEEAQDGGTPCAKRRSPSHDMSWQMGPQETNAEPQGSAEPEKSATDPPATMGGTGMGFVPCILGRDTQEICRGLHTSDGMKAMYSGREYGHLAMLRSHLQTHSDQLQCKLCEETFASASELRLHTPRHLEVHIRKLHASLEPVLKCQLCGKIGYRHQILEQNQQRRRDEKQGGDRESGEMSLLDGERDLGPRGEVTPKYRLLSEKVEGGSIISTL
ncbi:transcriptional repressor CTCFL isoform X3 [Dendropsophus ebraccatus]|uniref:transcriptional repressor CTCFL isoform X3 n=1 Tax=Dendropsophus ebraccatus TaxID=150705 RepID=UPI0038311132